jgi:hypothetical protein
VTFDEHVGSSLGRQIVAGGALFSADDALLREPVNLPRFHGHIHDTAEDRTS